MTRQALRLLLLLYIISIGSTTSGFAQMDTLVYGVKHIAIEPETKGELRLAIETMPFMRDNEYKGDFVKGYTLPGVWLQPCVSYQPLKNLRLEVGAHMLHFWGAEKYPNFNYSELAEWHGRNVQNGFHCVPIVRAQMQLSPTVNVVLGTLHGKSNHGLAEPLYNDEINLSGDPETGVQVIWDCHLLRLDAWVNWESFIFDKDDGQESFSFGLSTRWKPSHKKSRLQWYIPVQAVFQHRGGEINTQANDRVIKTWLNAATGVGVNLPLATHFPAKLNFEVIGAYYSQQAGDKLPFNHGDGLYAKATAQLWRVKASVGYWSCHKFVSILGNPLFGSISVNENDVTYRNPQMLTAHVEYAQNLGTGFAWGIAADLFHHLPVDKMNLSEGLVHEKSKLSIATGIYLRACPSFLIKKYKQVNSKEQNVL